MRESRHCQKTCLRTANASLDACTIPVVISYSYILGSEKGLGHHLPTSIVSKSVTTYRLSFAKDKMAACHVRSASLPSSSHPLKGSVEDQLDSLRSSQTTSTSAYQKLSGLKVLYECVDDFLQLPLTQQTLSNEQERAEEVLNGSFLLLDVCSTIRDVFSSMKECLQKLESSLRRRKVGESSLASEVEAFMMSRKQLNKTIYKCFRNLKRVENNATNMDDMVAMLREVKEISLEIFQSLGSLVSQPKVRSRSKSLVSKFFQSKRVSGEGEANELEKIDAELFVLKSSKDINHVQVQNVLKGLEALESNIQEAEEELEAVYRKLVKTRVSILNILSI